MNPVLPHSPALALAACAALVSIAAPAARADEFVDRANKAYADIGPDRRSDTVLLPLIAKVEQPPGVVSDIDRAMMLPAGAAGWNDAASWAQRPDQRALLDKIHAMGADWEQHPTWAFGQPYGVEGVPIETVAARLYTELGDPPTLAAARFMYLDGLAKAEILAHVEATRLTAEGQIGDALVLLTDWMFFTRQIADREFYREFAWGLAASTRAAERMRDCTYQDWLAKKNFADSARADKVGPFIDRLDLDHGVPAIPRLRFPVGERIASEQVIAQVYVPRGSVNPDAFMATLARLGSAERPLRLFGEAAGLRQLASTQENWFDITDRLPKLYEDWAGRWDLDPFDRRMATPYYFDTKLPKQRAAAISKVIPDMTGLFGARQIFRTELVGTRTALGLMGFWYANRALAPTIASIRPRWVKALDMDPFNPDRARGQQPPLEYFVPIRDQPRAPREEPKPHEVNVFVPSGDNFVVRFRDDQFLLYSVGPDGAKQWATRVQNTAEEAPGADYLLWPPVISLYRQHLMDTGALK